MTTPINQALIHLVQRNEELETQVAELKSSVDILQQDCITLTQREQDSIKNLNWQIDRCTEANETLSTQLNWHKGEVRRLVKYTDILRAKLANTKHKL